MCEELCVDGELATACDDCGAPLCHDADTRAGARLPGSLVEGETWCEACHAVRWSRDFAEE